MDNEEKLYNEYGILYCYKPFTTGIKYRFAWEHLPTNSYGEKEIWILGGRFQLLILLNNWNKQKNWKYYEIE